MLLWVLVQGAAGQPAAGEVIIAWHVTIAPSWFDPSTAPAQITPFGILYALHDAVVRPLPGQKMGPSLAESWKESPDGLSYEFKLRRGLKFHNGDPVTAEDVKFSYDRYKGAGANELAARVRQVEVVDPLTIRFSSEGTLAGLHDLLRHHRHRGRTGGPQEIRHAGRRRGIPQASDRGGAVSLREPPARRRGGPGSQRRVLAPSAPREAGDHEERARGDHASHHAEEGGSGHRLRARWRGRRERAARPPAHARTVQARLHLLDRAHRAMGPEVAVGRQAGAPGRHLRARPQGDQRRGMPRATVRPPASSFRA